MFQPAPLTNYSDPKITVKGQKLQTVDKFTYLGKTLSRNVFIDDKVDARIAKASTAFGRLRKNVWERQEFNLQKKLEDYKVLIKTPLHYACETWTVYCRHAMKLHRCHISCLRRLLRITWLDMFPDTEVIKRSGLQRIHVLLKSAQLDGLGMLSERAMKGYQSVCWMENCQRGGGQLDVNVIDSLISSLKAFEISNESWESLAVERRT